VSSKLLGQFAASLEQLLASSPEPSSETEPVTEAADAAQSPASSPAAFRPTAAPQPVDLTHLAGGAVAKRALPVLAAIVVVGVIIYVIVR